MYLSLPWQCQAHLTLWNELTNTGNVSLGLICHRTKNKCKGKKYLWLYDLKENVYSVHCCEIAHHLLKCIFMYPCLEQKDNWWVISFNKGICGLQYECKTIWPMMEPNVHSRIMDHHSSPKRAILQRKKANVTQI